MRAPRTAAWLCAALLLPPALAGQAPHPLDPLGTAEIAAAVGVLRAAGRFTDASSLVTLELREPDKDAAPGAGGREAFAVVYERAERATYEAVVDLAARRVRSWRAVPGVQPPFLASDYLLLVEVVQADPRWRAAMRARGIADPREVTLAPWMGGDYGDPAGRGARLIRATFNYRGRARNEHARPVEGVVAVVDLDARRVRELIDTGVVPLAEPHDYQRAAGPPRAAFAPLPAAPGAAPDFVAEGHEVRWDRWRFRWAVHPRDGLVLYAAAFRDGGRERPVLYRASVSEMVVPYGDPGPAWYFRNAFDQGEFGLGAGSTSRLDPGVDAPPGAVFLPAVYADEVGEAVEVPRAAVLYERDGGVLWKHADVFAGENEARRARELVLAYSVTVGNYDYVFRWIFRVDGVLEHQVQLTGVMAVKGVSDGAASHGHGSGHRVQRGLEAVHHQHFFNYRLDLDVDGPRNRVVEANARALPPGRGNPHGNAFTVQETVLERERGARRNLSLESGRAWRVLSSTARNGLGEPTGYALLPATNAVPYAHPTASVRRRAGFVDAHLWVTPYAPGEMNAAGPYVNQSRGGEGLPTWTRADRGLVDRDVVLWYTLGTTHLPRPEEWPVMPATTIGFRLVPFGFFDRNPALDPAPPP